MSSWVKHATYMFNTHYSKNIATIMKMFGYVPPKIILHAKTWNSFNTLGNIKS